MTFRSFIIAALCGGAAAVSACSSPQTSGTSAAGSAPAAPVTQAPSRQADPRFLADDLPLLPENIDRAVRPLAIVRASYEFAARHPEVMKYVPCFCGCERGGHKDNHDCFVGSRGADNRVTGWESHGMVCEVCIDVATQARQMHNSGASVSAIRDAIEKTYASHYEGHTPTPMPKRGGATR